MVWRTLGVNLRPMLSGVILSGLPLGFVVGANCVHNKADIFMNLGPMIGCYIAAMAFLLVVASLFSSAPEIIMLMVYGGFTIVPAIPVLLIGELLGKISSSAV
jgi:hypothetical protein